MSPKQAKPKKRWMPLVIRAAFSGGILTYLGTRVDWGHVAEAFRGLRVGYWAVAVGLYIFCQLLCSARWMWLSRPMGFTQSLARFTGIYFVGMFFNLFLPTSVGGDAVRAVYLARGHGRRVDALLSVLLDRLSGLLVLIGLVCVAAIFCPVELPAQIQVAVWGIGLAAVVGVAAMPFVTRLLSKWHWPGDGLAARTVSRLRHLAHSGEKAVALCRDRPGMLAGTTVISVVVQVLNAVIVGLVGVGLGLDVPPVYYGVAAPMVVLLTLVPISVNGLGLREGGMVLFLAPVGVAPAAAITLAFLWFSVQTAASLCGAAVYLFGRFSPPEDLSGERATLDRHSGEGRASQYLAAA